jgi:hypothetical protein
MAMASLLIKIGADISELQVNAAKATATFEKTAAKLDTIGSTIGKSMLAAFSVGAVVAWADKTIASASRIDDLSKKLKVSTDAVQGWSYAMQLSGGSIEDVDTALSFMNKTLGKGGSGTIDALKDAGLSFDDIRKMAPEQAFNTIAEAVGNIKDPLVQAAVAAALFGRNNGALLTALADDFQKTADSASKLTKEEIANLDTLGDAWDTLTTKAGVWSGSFISALTDVVADGRRKWHDFFVAMHLDTQGAIDDLKDLQQWMHVLDAANGPKAPGAPSAFMPKPIAPIGLSDADARDMEQSLDRVRKKMDEGAKAAHQQADKINELARSFRGTDVIDKATEAIKAINVNMKAGFTIAMMTTDQQDALNRMMADGIDVFKRHGQVAPQAMRDLYVATVRMPDVLNEIAASAGTIGKEFDLVIPKADAIAASLSYVSGIPFGVKIGEQIDLVPPKIQMAHDHLGDLAQSLTQLSQVAGGTFSGIAQGLATLVTSADSAKTGINAFRDGLKDYKSGSSWEGILGMTSGIMGIATAAISAGKVLFDLFDRNKGRDLVVDFADTLGGFDQLHTKLLALGDEGEVLWVKLTQGVGRNNPMQAQAAIDAVTAALNRQNSAQDTAQSATEEQAQATIETATQAALALQELGAKLATNAAEWGDWSRHVTDYIEDIGRSIRALPIPAPAGGVGGGDVPGYASGTHGKYINFGTGTLAMLHGHERVVTQHEALGIESGGQLTIQAADLPKFLRGEIVAVTRNDAAKGGLRTRPTGRSY